MSDDSKMRVVDFYNDSVILISGATGFMGQVLLEKILRDLRPRKIYLLIRSKRGLDADNRLKKILEGKVFDRVRQSGRINCIEPLSVDFEKDDLALSESYCEILSEQVNVVFCLTASVRFDEELADALRVNVDYNKRVLQLASSFRQLKSVVYVSTFYSNCNEVFIEEKIYPDEAFDGCSNKVNQTCVQIDSSENIPAIFKIPDGFPNSYTYSKKIAELTISKCYRNLPIGIFRPPIVVCTYGEPFAGWIDNLNGPSGLIAAIKRGMILGISIDLQKKPFLAPVDYCANAMICCAVDVFNRNRLHPENIPVYNFTDDSQKIRWKDMYKAILQSIPTPRRYFHRYVLTTMSPNRFVIYTVQSIMRLQGYLIDLFQCSARKNTSRIKKILKVIISLKFFCLNDWKMHNSNMIGVVDGLSSKEAAQFPCDLRKINWNDLFTVYMKGVDQYVQSLQVKAANVKQ